jgi:hypothetical protein
MIELEICREEYLDGVSDKMRGIYRRAATVSLVLQGRLQPSIER